MPPGNSSDASAVIANLKAIRALIDESIQLLSGRQAKFETRRRVAPRPSTGGAQPDLDFSIPVRPFIKKYSAGMSAAKKFTLLVARLTDGDATKSVSLDEITKQWNRITERGLMGMKFNRSYTARAKNEDWVTTQKNGHYHLRPSWMDIFA